jgi:hypothetical protein
MLLLLSSFAFFFIHLADNYVSLLLEDKAHIQFSGRNLTHKSKLQPSKVIILGTEGGTQGEELLPSKSARPLVQTPVSPKEKHYNFSWAKHSKVF